MFSMKYKINMKLREYTKPKISSLNVLIKFTNFWQT